MCGAAIRRLVQQLPQQALGSWLGIHGKDAVDYIFVWGDDVVENHGKSMAHDFLLAFVSPDGDGSIPITIFGGINIH